MKICLLLATILVVTLYARAQEDGNLIISENDQAAEGKNDDLYMRKENRRSHSEEPEDPEYEMLKKKLTSLLMKLYGQQETVAPIIEDDSLNAEEDKRVAYIGNKNRRSLSDKPEGSEMEEMLRKLLASELRKIVGKKGSGVEIIKNTTVRGVGPKTVAIIQTQAGERTLIEDTQVTAEGEGAVSGIFRSSAPTELTNEKYDILKRRLRSMLKSEMQNEELGKKIFGKKNRRSLCEEPESRKKYCKKSSGTKIITNTTVQSIGQDSVALIKTYPGDNTMIKDTIVTSVLRGSAAGIFRKKRSTRTDLTNERYDILKGRLRYIFKAENYNEERRPIRIIKDTVLDVHGDHSVLRVVATPGEDIIIQGNEMRIRGARSRIIVDRKKRSAAERTSNEMKPNL